MILPQTSEIKPVSRSPNVRLLVIEKPAADQEASSTEINLPPGAYVVGRAQSCHIVLAPLEVSRRHMLLTVHEHHKVSVKDLDSKNGVYVNGVRIPPQQDCEIRVGEDVLFLGQTKLHVY